jgi:hypothetical protein
MLKVLLVFFFIYLVFLSVPPFFFPYLLSSSALFLLTFLFPYIFLALIPPFTVSCHPFTPSLPYSYRPPVFIFFLPFILPPSLFVYLLHLVKPSSVIPIFSFLLLALHIRRFLSIFISSCLLSSPCHTILTELLFLFIHLLTDVSLFT